MARARAAGRTGKRDRRPRRLLARVVFGLVLLWFAACFLVVAEPTSNKPARVDAILVLGPPDVDGRVDSGYAFAQARYAGTLVISVQSDEQQRAKHACADGIAAYRVICFQPHPGTTLGEGREIRQLVASHHWHSVLVVTSKYHVSRARMIIDRCLPDSTVLVVAAPGRPSLATWAYQFAYQTAGYVKAFAHSGC